MGAFPLTHSLILPSVLLVNCIGPPRTRKQSAMKDEKVLPKPVKRDRPVDVSADKTALDLSAELAIAKQKFQAEKEEAAAASEQGPIYRKKRKKHQSGRTRDAKKALDPNNHDASYDALAAKVKDYELIKRGDQQSELLIPSANPLSSSDSESSDYQSESSATRLVEVDEGDFTDFVPANRFSQPPPERLLYGDLIQRGAFELDSSQAQRIQQDAQEDPIDVHYDPDWEVRQRGVGFYRFSKDNATREAQMESLKQAREATRAKNDELGQLMARRDDRRRKRQEAFEKQKQATLERMGRIGQLRQ